MKYIEFESVMSIARMSRYLNACNGNSLKAMTLYRKNLQLSQEMFTLVSCFEVALRNAIDKHYLNHFGNDWLRDSARPNGIFSNRQCRITSQIITDEVNKLNRQYTHGKLVAALGFGFWRFLFSAHQYRAGGQNLLSIFPLKPSSSRTFQYNAAYIFNELDKINEVRNRIAHHEPICFTLGGYNKDTIYARQHYNLIVQLFQWMDIDESSLLYGLDHIHKVCEVIDAL